MARVHYPTNAGQAWARREAIGGDARLASEMPILLKSRPQSTGWAQSGDPRRRRQQASQKSSLQPAAASWAQCSSDLTLCRIRW
jgi:hypothetical protein